MFVSVSVLCYLIAAVEPLRRDASVVAGSDSSRKDMHGTQFVFPHPMCRRDTYYMVQMVPRGFDPVIATVKDELQSVDFDEVDTGITHFADMRDGNSSTVVLLCKLYHSEGIIRKGSVSVEATAEILLYVLYGNDSFPVPPINALGNEYVVQSFPPGTKPTGYFIFIATVAALNAITIMDLNKNESIFVLLKERDMYIYWSEFSLTGTKIESANNSIMVVSGVCEGNKRTPEMCFPLFETMIPVSSWGKFYVFIVPFDSSKATLLVAAYSNVKSASIYARIQWGGASLVLKPDGTPIDVSQLKNGDKSMVTVRGTRPFQLLFLLTSETIENPYLLTYAPSYRVHSLISVPPVEQYYSDPCAFGHRNVLLKQTIVAGMPSIGRASVNATLDEQLGHRAPLGPFWIATRSNMVTFFMGDKLAKPVEAAEGNFARLWFNDMTIIKRYQAAYYLSGGFNLFKLDIGRCTGNVSRGAVADDDCDGLVDEELKNGQDDDMDGKTDEDVFSGISYECTGRIARRYTWEPFRYRLTRHESTGVELARRLPKYNTVMVSISASVGVLMVLVFMFVVWLIDAFEMYLDPYRKFNVF